MALFSRWLVTGLSIEVFSSNGFKCHIIYSLVRLQYYWVNQTKKDYVTKLWFGETKNTYTNFTRKVWKKLLLWRRWENNGKLNWIYLVQGIFHWYDIANMITNVPFPWKTKEFLRECAIHFFTRTLLYGAIDYIITMYWLMHLLRCPFSTVRSRKLEIIIN